MQITMRPQVQNLSLSRECPSGKIKISGTLGFYSPGGMSVASKSIGGYDGLKVEFSDATLKMAQEFMLSLLKDVEGVFEEQFKENLEARLAEPQVE